MAIHLDPSRERLRALVAEGVIEQAPGGGFDLDKARRAYIRWLRQRPTRSASQDALERKNGFDIRSAACNDDYSLGVVLGENTDYVDSLRADR
jgi:hypothetical protein